MIQSWYINVVLTGEEKMANAAEVLNILITGMGLPVAET